MPDFYMTFMQHVKVPWIAFKVLAAGAIPPEDGFDFAFDSGADFVCAGMFDFQLNFCKTLVSSGTGCGTCRQSRNKIKESQTSMDGMTVATQIQPVG